LLDAGLGFHDRKPPPAWVAKSIDYEVSFRAARLDHVSSYGSNQTVGVQGRSGGRRLKAYIGKYGSHPSSPN